MILALASPCLRCLDFKTYCNAMLLLFETELERVSKETKGYLWRIAMHLSAPF